jgi:hypothetical protein
MPGRTLRDLRQAAETLGFESREQVQAVLEAVGLGGDFKPCLWADYLSALLVHAQKAEQLLWKAWDAQSRSLPGPCPVCGAEIQTCDGPHRGWTCTQGGTAHYGWAQANRVRQSIGLPPIDYGLLEQRRQETLKRDEVIRRLYWKSILGLTTEEEESEFKEAYGP